MELIDVMSAYTPDLISLVVSLLDLFKTNTIVGKKYIPSPADLDGTFSEVLIDLATVLSAALSTLITVKSDIYK